SAPRTCARNSSTSAKQTASSGVSKSSAWTIPRFPPKRSRISPILFPVLPTGWLAATACRFSSTAFTSPTATRNSFAARTSRAWISARFAPSRESAAIPRFSILCRPSNRDSAALLSPRSARSRAAFPAPSLRRHCFSKMSRFADSTASRAACPSCPSPSCSNSAQLIALFNLCENFSVVIQAQFVRLKRKRDSQRRSGFADLHPADNSGLALYVNVDGKRVFPSRGHSRLGHSPIHFPLVVGRRFHAIVEVILRDSCSVNVFVEEPIHSMVLVNIHVRRHVTFDHRFEIFGRRSFAGEALCKVLHQELELLVGRFTSGVVQHRPQHLQHV